MVVNGIIRIFGKWVNARYSRTLTAKDGNPTPWTVCLPYELDLSAAVSKGQADIYTLAYDAFALQSGDLTWISYDPESEATIPAFRAFLSSSRIDKTAHQARYE